MLFHINSKFQRSTKMCSKQSVPVKIYNAGGSSTFKKSRVTVSLRSLSLRVYMSWPGLSELSAALI